MLKFYLVLLTVLLWLAPMTGSMAEERSHSGKHFRSGIEHRLKDSRHKGGGDHGNETTGQLAVWLLIAANLAVITSVLIKGANRLLPLGEGTKKTLVKFNQTQKKYLMRFHWLLNPGILAIAILHWSLSRCRTTSLPEWGLILMVILAGLGLLLKLKLAPKSSIKFLYKVHTNPVVVVSIVLVLLAGHLIVD